jgi:hypothetical protein
VNHTVVGLGLLVVLAVLTGCDPPDPAKDIRADCTDLTYEFYVCKVPMPDGRIIDCIANSGSRGSLSCDWSPK